MAWVYLDDGFPDHPKVATAGGPAAWLFVCGLAYARRHDTKGWIPKAVVARLTDAKQPVKLAKALVEVNLWEDRGDRYYIHDYHEWNKPTEARSAAGRKAAMARWAKDVGSANGQQDDAVGNAIASEPHKPSRETADASTCPPPRPQPRPKRENQTMAAPPTLAGVAVSPTTAPSARKRDPLWDAFAEEVGFQPGTPKERGSWNSGLADLRHADATADEVHRACAAYRQRFPNAPLTLPALAKHWSACLNAPEPGPKMSRNYETIQRVAAELQARQDALDAHGNSNGSAIETTGYDLAALPLVTRSLP